MPRVEGSLGRQYPPNPAYGTEIFRRRLRFATEAGVVHAALTDPYHAMWLRLTLRDDIITEVDAGIDRAPKTVCPGATLALRELEGMPVETAAARSFADGRAGRNCTHLLDLARAALGCHQRGEAAWVLDLTVPDPDPAGRTRITSAVDGITMHAWTLADGQLTDDAGRPCGAFGPDFLPLICERFAGIELEAARALRLAVFVAAGRAYITDGPNPVRALDETDRHGDCFAFSPSMLALSRDNIGYVQDFTERLIERPPVWTRGAS